ncbi:hypothetical protein FD03_GL001152 [Companilactobacillus nodensis DSM 19682 = JCM 14932 = NBRC 107160]|uniref:Uncharacterized protein n=2 Tax=Companilactobacillus nodensis TaxID=460870 RepID=A0A0R1KCI9_9LACO|nr:hypothetical protein FD03_GL001152 [Companilactobacillus nodensis DSM 19682 = JCM 14932 = NBRC 107160]
MDRNKVNFKFKATEDESTASDTTNYLVDMTIKNTSKTNVKFNLSKFVMLNPYDDSTKVTSSKKNTVIVKPGQSKIINSIFEKVSKDILDGQGAYYYLNKDYKLAYFYKSYNGNGVTSDNLKSGPARKFNIKKHESVVKNTTDTDNTQNQNINQQATSNDISNTQQNSTQSTDTSSQNIITTESQAIGLFKHMWGMEARDDFAAYPVDGGFFVHSTTDGFESLDSTILYNGDAISPDGTVTKYAQLSRPLNSDISDGKPFDPSRY